MHKVVVEREMNVTPERAWELLDDFGSVYRYHPIVEKSPIDNGVASGLGAERVCHFDNGDQIKERITDYSAGKEFTVEIVDPGKFPLKTAEARLALSPIERDRSRVSFEMAFEPKYGPIGWVMGATVMQSQFRKILSSVLEGFETHATTGEIVSRRNSVPTAA